MNYNFQYIRFPNIFNNTCSINTPLLQKLEKHIHIKRQKFIIKNGLSIDETNTILPPQLTLELLKHSHKLAKHIDRMYLAFIQNKS